ncbi:sec-12 [Pristionchus pacificus]|uniref:Sec-12 n=1 Tax=Pristionchus pacificus TaxID=54126 RepID=A0A2A6BG30_PRIPA|nr:sec-12 [Pristionchus pacificus]|eukprot:PDM64875.1 sec-12 [Pristionchus pacificus]
MGNINSRKAPPVVAIGASPVYSVRRIGSRHIVLAEGGGAAATGVTNQLEVLLLSSNLNTSASNLPIRATVAQQIGTDKYSNMNMDVACADTPDKGLYYIACGQDEYCTIYETTGFVGDVKDEDKRLSFGVREVGRLTTDDSYQRCCSFDPTSRGGRLVTGGENGHVKVWNVRDLVEYRDPRLARDPLLKIEAHTANVDSVDVSPDGRYIVSVGDGTAHIWDMQFGRKVTSLTPPAGLTKGWKVRTVKFTPLGEQNMYLLAAFNQVARTSKSQSFLVIYEFNRQAATLQPKAVQGLKIGETISTLALSQDGNLCAVGSMDGSVYVLETIDLKELHAAPNTHGIFVTGIEFLDRSSRDVLLPRDLALRGALPGPAANHRASIVSLSADKTVQLHSVSFESSTPFSVSILKIALWSSLLYFVFWTIMSYF